jgi:hypothetical protein
MPSSVRRPDRGDPGARVRATVQGHREPDLGRHLRHRRAGHHRGTDDLVIMPLQSGTQWDAPSHIISDGTAATGDYAGGHAPGLGLATVPWIADHQIAGLATDTWGMEVLPNETPDVFQPLHCILLVGMGLHVGEIFDLEALAESARLLVVLVGELRRDRYAVPGHRRRSGVRARCCPQHRSAERRRRADEVSRQCLRPQEVTRSGRRATKRGSDQAGCGTNRRGVHG